KPFGVIVQKKPTQFRRRSEIPNAGGSCARYLTHVSTWRGSRTSSITPPLRTIRHRRKFPANTERNATAKQIPPGMISRMPLHRPSSIVLSPDTLGRRILLLTKLLERSLAHQELKRLQAGWDLDAGSLHRPRPLDGVAAARSARVRFMSGHNGSPIW